jgi:hypothetical protein
MCDRTRYRTRLPRDVRTPARTGFTEKLGKTGSTLLFIGATPRNAARGDARQFYAGMALQKFEIPKVFPHFCASF